MTQCETKTPLLRIQQNESTGDTGYSSLEKTGLYFWSSGAFIFGPDEQTLRKQHAALLEQAMHAQRGGDIRTYSKLSTEAEDIYKKIQEIEAAEGK